MKSILQKITTGRCARAQKVCIYAPEGYGKSTLAAQFPRPLFLDVEDSTSQLAVGRLGRTALPDLKSFESALAEIIAAKPCATLVVDTVDWLEQLALDDVVASAASRKVRGLEDFGYGKGYTILRERMAHVLARLDAVIAAGIHVVLLAHARVARFEPPDGTAPCDRYELKLTRHVAPLIKEWADMLLFGNWHTHSPAPAGIDDAQGETLEGVGRRERQLYCSRSSAWDAKNRHGMADMERWDIGVIEWAFRNVGAPWEGEPPAAVPVQLPVPGLPPAAAALASGTPRAPLTLVAPLDGSVGSVGSVSSPLLSAAAPLSTVYCPTVHSPPAAPSADDLAKICQPHADAVNDYLRTHNRVKPTEDWRAMPADFAARVLRNPVGFLKVALGGKAVAA